MFWIQERKTICSGDDSTPFQKLIELICNLFCFPHSSANVERKFYNINLLKTKEINLLNTYTLLMHSKKLIGNKDLLLLSSE